MDHVRAVAEHYRTVIFDRVGWEMENCGADTSEGRLAHALWMCGRIEGMLTQEVVLDADVEKANRWLGFVQGVLWCEGILTIQEMRDHNREIGNVPGVVFDESC